MFALRRRMPQRARGNALKFFITGFVALSVSACAGQKENPSPLPGQQTAVQKPQPPKSSPPKKALPKPSAPKPDVPKQVEAPKRPSPPSVSVPPAAPAVPVPPQYISGPPPPVVIPPQPQPPQQSVPNFAPVAVQPTQPILPIQPVQPLQPPAPYAPPPADLDLQPAVKRFTFASLPGWAQGDHAPVLVSLREACDKIANRGADEKIGGVVFNGAPVFGNGNDWRAICTEAVRTPDAQARGFFERWFEPVSIRGAGEAQAALYTAYFEPELRGSRTRGGPYQYPIYRKPPELQRGVPFFDRAQIQGGALAGRGLELFWIDDPVEAFFLEIQGSGRVRLPDGSVARVGFAGKNGHAYKAIGKTLVEWGALPLEQVSLQSIKGWIRANPQRRDQLLATNRSYVFFIERPELSADPSLGPIGTFGQPLPAMRSIAVDRKSYALGIPFWIDFDSPVGTMQRLVIALDTGGAIKGPRRADFFFGSGDGPGQAAGATRARGRLIALAPTAALRRVFRAGS